MLTFAALLRKRPVLFTMSIAELAQLVEQRIRNAWVGGSSPPFGSKMPLPLTEEVSLFLYADI